MAKEKKKWFWPTVRVGLPIGIVAAGIVFVVLAVIFKLIDVGSARYLLSAIVQSLAALLAIIFAGVAILWGQGIDSLRELGSLRLQTKLALFKKEEGIDTGIISVYKFCFNSYKDLAEGEKKEWRSKLASLTILLLIGTPALDYLLSGIKNTKRDELAKTIDLAKEEFSEDEMKNFRLTAKLLLTKFSLKAFFEAVKDAIVLFGYFSTKVNPEEQTESYIYYVAGTDSVMTITDYLSQATGYIRKVELSKRARGPWFKFLITLYSITVAGGMVFLSILKKGVLDLQATWYAAGPLLFGIGAVALTFIYLANIISGEKDG